MAQFLDPHPSRVRVLVLGGGIHGAGVLHDLASRGWRDVHLLEKSRVAYGTSQRSTKLIHGGLRYLQNPRDFPLVYEALHERELLLKLVPDLVHPLEFIFPISRKGGMPGPMVKVGLTLYDLLAGSSNIHRHKSVELDYVERLVPHLKGDAFKKYYSFWDGQTDDLRLTQRVAQSAKKLGASISEGTEAIRMWPSEDGWSVECRTAAGKITTISALYVVNALGPWSNAFLERSGIEPTHRGINDKGSHLVFPDMGLKAGLFLQSPEDGRIFFVLPWLGRTLVGTTEKIFKGNPDQLVADKDEVQYLLEHTNRYLKEPLRERDIVTTFAGLRWLPLARGSDISSTSRSHIIGEKKSQRGLLFTIYGGKFTTYRSLSASLGDRITRHFGEFRSTQTDEADMWELGEIAPMDVRSRFEPPKAS